MNELAAFESADLNLDFATLQSADDYARYFNLLKLVFIRLLDCYAAGDDGERAAGEIVSGYLRRLLHTVEVLRIKYAWSGNKIHPLWVDLSESGFPNFSEIACLETEMLGKQQRIRDLPALQVLKRAVLDRLFREQKDPVALLEQLSEHTYLQMLQAEQIFRPFTAGPLKLKGTSEDYRNYDFSWACYDYNSNRIYLHFLNFDHDKTAYPLESMADSYSRFIKASGLVGSRAPDVGILGMSLDEALEEVHPKTLKRRCLGPLYSPLTTRAGGESNLPDGREPAIAQVLHRHCSREDDFLLFFTDEILFSARQERRGTDRKLREVFFINQEDPECAERRASAVQHNVLLPHRLLQLMNADEQAAIAGFASCRKYVFNENGKVHGI